MAAAAAAQLIACGQRQRKIPTRRPTGSWEQMQMLRMGTRKLWMSERQCWRATPDIAVRMSAAKSTNHRLLHAYTMEEV